MLKTKLGNKQLTEALDGMVGHNSTVKEGLLFPPGSVQVGRTPHSGFPAGGYLGWTGVASWGFCCHGRWSNYGWNPIPFYPVPL